MAGRSRLIQARTAQQVKHADFRQDRINVLRERMARYHAPACTRPDKARTAPEVAEAMLWVVMQMSPKDALHPRLTDLMSAAMGGGSKASETNPRDGGSSEDGAGTDVADRRLSMSGITVPRHGRARTTFQETAGKSAQAS